LAIIITFRYFTKKEEEAVWIYHWLWLCWYF